MPATFEAREARTRGCSPLVTPKKLSRCKNASRFAKRIFLHLSDLLLRSRLYAFAERKVLRKRNTLGGAVNRRSPKNAFSEAASIFGLRQPLWGLKGASSPFLVDPARRNRWCFSGSLLARKRELNLAQPRSILRRRRKNHSIVICSPSSSARTSAPVAGRLRTR